MIRILTVADRSRWPTAFESMHADRKRVFIDQLKWNLTHLAGLEVDQYDHGDAVYIVVLDDETGLHRGSVRLLRTDQPHILGDLFPTLCAEAPPRDPAIREITRLCISPDCPPSARVQVRRMLMSALVRYAAAARLTGFSAVTDVAFMSKVAATGWRCRPLGLPKQFDGLDLAALFIDIDDSTVELLRRAGTWVEHEEAPAASVLA